LKKVDKPVCNLRKNTAALDVMEREIINGQNMAGEKSDG
jgi:hypothetical protein